MNQEIKGVQFEDGNVYIDLVAVTECPESMDFLQNEGLELYPQHFLQLRSHMMAFDFTANVQANDGKTPEELLRKVPIMEPGIPEDIVTRLRAGKQGSGMLTILLSAFGCGNMLVHTLKIPFRVLYKS